VQLRSALIEDDADEQCTVGWAPGRHQASAFSLTSAAGSRIWNSLPPDLRRPDIELGEFRRLLKTFLFV